MEEKNMKTAGEAEQTRKAASEEEPLDLKKELLSWVKMFAIVIVIVLVLTKVIFINATIPSGSMETTIMTHDRLVGFRFSYWFADPQRGDIVLFTYPVDGKTTYIKRVIGLPGDKVVISDGEIYINDAKEPLEENYLPEEWVWNNDGLEYVVPEDCYFMMGDNRNNSLDSRSWAQEALDYGVADSLEEAYSYSFVNREDIMGKAIFRYFKGFKMLNHTADYQE